MKVCFFMPTAYSHFNPSAETWAGGAETQQILIARHMVDRGIEVSFVVGDYGQPEVEIVDGITLIKSFRPFQGNRRLRFIPDMLQIRRALSLADADVYNQRSTAFFTGQIAYFVSRMRRKFTFSLGIDYNCYRNCDGYLRKPIIPLYHYGIRKADAIISQTEYQRRLFQDNFHLDSIVIRNGMVIPLSPDPHPVSSPPGGGTGFLWVGSFRRRKRPHLFLELARRIPQARFTMIGGKGDDAGYFQSLVEETSSIPNLDYLGFVHPERIDGYYREAFAFINTSYLEGFPNTYLHSWIHGSPTFTLEIDPDGIISKNGIGAVTGDLEEMVRALNLLVRNPERRDEMSIRARRYVEREHDIRDRGDDYIRLFERLLRDG
ncbi:MAG: glycosyltransferase family 4 protein [Candidatus Krumholzibacteriota bacterium]|nr:glycosyltransferase family 4 protein [Candidatus Krumholzibacteriota bacterium]